MKYREHYINKSASALPKYNRECIISSAIRHSNESEYRYRNDNPVRTYNKKEEVELTKEDITLFNKILGVVPTHSINDR